MLQTMIPLSVVLGIQKKNWIRYIFVIFQVHCYIWDINGTNQNSDLKFPQWIFIPTGRLNDLHWAIE